jgi:hypothetical protein
MSDLRIGIMVILVGTDGCMPPLGSYGEIVEMPDEEGWYGVLFPHHPCPAGPEPWWFAPPSWLLPISGMPVIDYMTDEVAL